MIGLPRHLSERVHPLNAHPADASGEFVLYWMHHAVRGHENAALDVAMHLAHALDKPLLVYQGLAGNHRFNADRHHAFIVQGARDAAAELAARGVRYVFHLPSDPKAASPLAGLIKRAAALVFEDFPAPPFPRWSARWAAHASCQTVAVDASLIVPLRLKNKAFDRAFTFRDALKHDFDARVALGWPEVKLKVARYDGEVGFAEIDLAALDLVDALANCQIDHAIAPVAHTRGGSSAGYARWNEFKSAGGLEQYAQRRNDAAQEAPLGVSRLSPYLHHGHVSALRIAREANASGMRGADKFLDELWVWRELSYNFCAHSRDPEHFKALPAWAQQTLSEHAKDRRDTYAEGDLARAKSPAKLWNLLQMSLLKHGELHNNVRMTWGKGIPLWRPTPQAALATLIDLNHRYALDGNNPNSYGGLLWCLGLFDRPHAPPIKVFGAVRARPVSVHAQRLDQVAYAAHIARPALGSTARVAVIGAGIAGLSAARALADHGLEVVVFDKGRAPGGRLSSKTQGLPLGDHGAPYFSARDRRFLRTLEPLIEARTIARWNARFVQLSAQGVSDLKPHSRWVGVPNMVALIAGLASGLDVRCGVEIASVGGNRLSTQKGEDLGHFDWVLITAPPIQAAKLLGTSSQLRGLADSAPMTPCWTALFDYAEPLELGFDAAFVEGFGLRMIINEASKPGRKTATVCVHADVEFSRTHIDADPAQAIELISAALELALGHKLGRPINARAHFWRYAQSTGPAGVGSALDRVEQLGIAGDWLSDGRVEGAWLSGAALAGRLMSHLALSAS